MHDQELAGWGKSLVEEILLQAALAIPDSATSLERVAFSMPFLITADPSTGQLAVSYSRIGGEGMTLQVETPKSAET